MTKHLPVILASRLDEYIERRCEILRRNGILWIAFGVIQLLSGIWHPRDWVLLLMSAFIFIGLGIRDMLAYKRARSLESKSAQPTSALEKPFATSILGLDHISETAKPPSVLSTMYCPKCGELNKADVKFCHTCGENLKVVAQAMTRRWSTGFKGKLEKYLDEYLEHTNEQIRAASILGAIGGAALLFGSIYWLIIIMKR